MKCCPYRKRKITHKDRVQPENNTKKQPSTLAECLWLQEERRIRSRVVSRFEKGGRRCVVSQRLTMETLEGGEWVRIHDRIREFYQPELLTTPIGDVPLGLYGQEARNSMGLKPKDRVFIKKLLEEYDTTQIPNNQVWFQEMVYGGVPYLAQQVGPVSPAVVIAKDGTCMTPDEFKIMKSKMEAESNSAGTADSTQVASLSNTTVKSEYISQDSLSPQPGTQGMSIADLTPPSPGVILGPLARNVISLGEVSDAKEYQRAAGLGGTQEASQAWIEEREVQRLIMETMNKQGPQNPSIDLTGYYHQLPEGRLDHSVGQFSSTRRGSPSPSPARSQSEPGRASNDPPTDDWVAPVNPGETSPTPTFGDPSWGDKSLKGSKHQGKKNQLQKEAHKKGGGKAAANKKKGPEKKEETAAKKELEKQLKELKTLLEEAIKEKEEAAKAEAEAKIDKETAEKERQQEQDKRKTEAEAKDKIIKELKSKKFKTPNEAAVAQIMEDLHTKEAEKKSAQDEADKAKNEAAAEKQKAAAAAEEATKAKQEAREAEEQAKKAKSEATAAQKKATETEKMKNIWEKNAEQQGEATRRLATELVRTKHELKTEAVKSKSADEVAKEAIAHGEDLKQQIKQLNDSIFNGKANQDPLLIKWAKIAKLNSETDVTICPATGKYLLKPEAIRRMMAIPLTYFSPACSTIFDLLESLRPPFGGVELAPFLLFYVFFRDSRALLAPEAVSDVDEGAIRVRAYVLAGVRQPEPAKGANELVVPPSGRPQVLGRNADQERLMVRVRSVRDHCLVVGELLLSVSFSSFPFAFLAALFLAGVSRGPAPS